MPKINIINNICGVLEVGLKKASSKCFLIRSSILPLFGKGTTRGKEQGHHSVKTLKFPDISPTVLHMLNVAHIMV